MEVRSGVLILRGIAAADMTADQAHPQVDPAIASAQAILAALCARRDVPDLIKV